MVGGRRRRRCHYKNCDHHEGHKPERCTFRVIPKDHLRARLWLNLGGITNLTPKRVTAFNCFICSCHFQCGSDVPDEYIEEYEGGVEDVPDDNYHLKRPFQNSGEKSALNSPIAKTSRTDVVTPRTKIALDALLSLPLNAEMKERQETMPPKSSLKYSPRNQIWLQRGSSVRKKARKNLQVLLEMSKSKLEVSDWSRLSQNSTAFGDCDSLGVSPLDMCSTPIRPNHCPPFEVVDQNTAPLISTVENIVMDSNNNIDSGFEMSNSYQVDNPPSVEKQTEEKLYRSQAIQCELSFLCYLKARQQLSWEQFRFYTGVTKTMFEVLYDFLGGDEICSKLKYRYNERTPKRQQVIGDLLPKDKLFMTLLRLRRGIPLRDLGILFKITEGWASSVVSVWVRFMSLQFKLLESSMFPSAEAQNTLKPKCYEKFPNLRGIIDSSEFKIQSPKNFQQQSNTYSSYKSANTIKFLICISCHGGLSFISEAAEGSISDRKLLLDSGLLDRMLPQEALMADRGFDAEDIFDERDLELIMPAFLGQRKNFTARELIKNRAIAVSRIHVETFIGMIKQFRLVRYAIPNTMLPMASDLVKVCAFLANFQLPFIKNDDDDELS